MSLLKEYKSEVQHFAAGERSAYPPFPDYYFKPREQAILNEYRQCLVAELAAGGPAPVFPEQQVAGRIENTGMIRSRLLSVTGSAWSTS